MLTIRQRSTNQMQEGRICSFQSPHRRHMHIMGTRFRQGFWWLHRQPRRHYGLSLLPVQGRRRVLPAFEHQVLFEMERRIYPLIIFW